MAIAPGLSSAKFHESVADFGVVYGLGLQGLGMARIESNLLPKSVARSMAWASKTKYFLGAAILLLAVMLMCLGRVGLDRIAYARNESVRSMNKSVVNHADSRIKAAGQLEQRESEFAERIKKQLEQFKYRDTVAGLHELLISALPNARNNPEQRALYEAFEAGDVQSVMEIPRRERKQLFITNLSIYYSDDLATAQFGETAMMRKDAMMQMAAGEAGGGYEDEMASMLELYGEEYMRQMGFGDTAEEDKHPGFIVSVVGYSPYKPVSVVQPGGHAFPAEEGCRGPRTRRAHGRRCHGDYPRRGQWENLVAGRPDGYGLRIHHLRHPDSRGSDDPGTHQRQGRNGSVRQAQV